ncbi:hypothetical protein ACIP8Z_10635 [Streptomyces sp. NPDC088553]|uniref:hypothetical protein n=1 Tax=Streptomyces sp. NPDC088553 TaxID=3365864 RepID=UPI00381AE48C
MIASHAVKDRNEWTSWRGIALNPKWRSPSGAAEDHNSFRSGWYLGASVMAVSRREAEDRNVLLGGVGTLKHGMAVALRSG